MKTKKQYIPVKAKCESEVRQALRRFFGAVDEVLRASEVARRARNDLEKLTLRNLKEERNDE
jgi:hypothetical protein